MDDREKASYFLTYNISNLAKDLIQSEYHLRRLKKGPIQGGHANCVVKHSLHEEGEAEEATSHALIVEGSEKSHNFKVLGDNIREFRKRVQKGNLSRDDAIRQVRELRSEFESFNPEFDVSQCESCGSIEDFLKQAKTLDNPVKEKVLNTPPNNRSYSEKIMNVAVVYGASFGGKLIDEVLIPMLPPEADLPVTVGLAAGLPILAKVMKLGDVAGTLATVVGAYESTKLWDIAEQYLAPTPAARAAAQIQARQVVPQRVAPQNFVAQPTAISKYVVTG